MIRKRLQQVLLARNCRKQGYTNWAAYHARQAVAGLHWLPSWAAERWMMYWSKGR